VVTNGRGDVVSDLLGVDRARCPTVLEAAISSWRTPIDCDGVGAGTTVTDSSSMGASCVVGSKLPALMTPIECRSSKMIVGYSMMRLNG